MSSWPTVWRVAWTVVCLAVALNLDAAVAESSSLSKKDISAMSIEELMEVEIPTVFGASRFEQKETKAPASVTVVTAEEVKQHGQRTLADMLNGLPGLYVTYDRNYYYLGVRGFSPPGDYGTRVLILVDGHRLNDAVYYSAFIGRDFVLDVDMIDHLEVIRGPGSSLYGNNAFFGVINIVTRKGGALRGAEVSCAYGTYDSYNARLTYGKRFKNDIEVVLSGRFYESPGADSLYFQEFDSPATNFGRAMKGDDEAAKNFLATVSYRDFTLQGGFVTREKGMPTASYGTVFNDSRNRTLDERGYLDLKFERAFEYDHAVMARVHVDRYKYLGDYIYDYALPDLTVNKDYACGEWWGGELQVNKKLWDRHTVSFGGEFHDQLRQDQRNYYVQPFRMVLDDHRSSLDWGVFLQADVSVMTNLTVNAGGRYDHFEAFGGTANPRIALIYSPHPSSALKFIYGSAFRAPNVYELYYSDPTYSKGNPQLQPETIKTHELVWSQNLGSHVRANWSGYYYSIDDLIAQEIDLADGLAVFVNRARAEGLGMELACEVRWAKGVAGRASYSLQHARDKGTGERLVNSPEHFGKLNLSVPVLPEKLFASIELLGLGPRKTLSGGVTDPAALLNLTLFSQNLVKGLELSASVYNLFDTQYEHPGGAEHMQDVILQDGRGFRVKAVFRF